MFVYFNFFNANESLFLYTNKNYNTSLDKITQRTNNKHHNKILI